MTDAPAVPRPRRVLAGPRPGQALALGVLTVVLLLIGAPPAQAHDALVRSTPAADAVVPTAPATVELQFAGTPQPLGTEVLVVGPDGAQVSSGAAEIRGTSVVQELTGLVPSGDYTVQWRSTSSDGHPLTGTFGFAVSAGSTPVAGSATSASVAPVARAPETPATTAAGGSGSPVGWLVAGLVALGAVGLVVRLRRRA